jgi:hypothetical protein
MLKKILITLANMNDSYPFPRISIHLPPPTITDTLKCLFCKAETKMCVTFFNVIAQEICEPSHSLRKLKAFLHHHHVACSHLLFLTPWATTFCLSPSPSVNLSIAWLVGYCCTPGKSVVTFNYYDYEQLHEFSFLPKTRLLVSCVDVKILWWR